MRCDQFEDRLNNILDRREDPSGDGELTAHAAVCGACRKLAKSYAALTSGAALLRERAELVVDLTPGNVAGPSFRRTTWLAPLLVTAAAVAFVYLRPTDDVLPLPPVTSPIAPVVAAQHGATPDFVPNLAAVEPSSLPTTLRKPISTPVVDLARTTGQAYVGLIHGTARRVDEAIAIASAWPQPQQLLEPMLFPEDGLLRQWEDRWGPVAGETFDALREVFQPVDSPGLEGAPSRAG